MRAAAYGLVLAAAVWASGGAAAPPEAAGLFGVWVAEAGAAAEPLPLRVAVAGTGAVPEHGAVPAQGTGPEADARVSAEVPVEGEGLPGGERRGPVPGAVPCGMPAVLETTQPVEIVDGGERVLMRFAEWGVERVVYLRPGDGPPSGRRSPLGASFGRWEGGTLAIFTLYIDYPFFDTRGTRQSKDVTVLERYTPSADGERLDYRVTVTDDAAFTRPVVRAGSMTRHAAAYLGALVVKDCVG